MLRWFDARSHYRDAGIIRSSPVFPGWFFARVGQEFGRARAGAGSAIISDGNPFVAGHSRDIIGSAALGARLVCGRGENRWRGLGLSVIFTRGPLEVGG